ncbi:MAG: acyl-CoA dehydrogenase family protein [Sporichthyaceae bacterium]
MTTGVQPGTVPEVRAAFTTWLREYEPRLKDLCAPGKDVAEQFSALRELQRLLYDAGWIRLGWSTRVGGLGGERILRAIVVEELCAAGYPPPFSFGTQEVLGPAVDTHAPAELAADLMPRLMRGDEIWCQGFSEPEAGSDLAALQCRAVADGEDWVLNGEKVWTSWAQVADRCLVLVRTGAKESAHRGITAVMLDMDTPGIDLRPLTSINGDAEFCSLYLDDVRVPRSRTIGEVDGGWAVAMTILASERGAAAWQRQTWLRVRLIDLIREAPALPAALIGEAYELIHSLRLCSRRTVRALSAGHDVGATPSFDKLLMSTAEKFLFATATEYLSTAVLFAGGVGPDGWRNDYLYSRASSIYGGAAEIQRDIVAGRILRLPGRS